ncbi:hypothetical protein [Francisella philomiragia]|uniref:hypothetical protein n=2 Tax=Francisella philomiragia TaxID=28110 RepID=UPI0019075B39|nr:hypothetical protein [Francisella philomiragia]MBK2293640.1 hypothetical protein [Francisella philomiragia]MBK2318390.1 hypothetical protein [Francisella philomiragia]
MSTQEDGYLIDLKKIESKGRKKFYINSSKLEKVIKDKMQKDLDEGIEYLLAQKMYHLEMQVFLDKMIDKINLKK